MVRKTLDSTAKSWRAPSNQVTSYVSSYRRTLTLPCSAVSGIDTSGQYLYTTLQCQQLLSYVGLAHINGVTYVAEVNCTAHALCISLLGVAINLDTAASMAVEANLALGTVTAAMATVASGLCCNSGLPGI